MNIRSYLSQNKYEILTSAIIFTNLFQQWIPSWIYFIGLLMVLYKYKKYNPKPLRYSGLFYAFIFILWFTSTVNFVLDLRLVLFTLVLIVSAPTRTLKWHNYKIKLLKFIYVGFACVTIMNLYAKYIGYNYLDVYKNEYVKDEVWQFSGYGRFPMWTSCAAAVSTMVFACYAFSPLLKNKLYRLLCFILMLASLFIVIISASRSSFVLAIFCSFLVIMMLSKSKVTLLRNIVIMGITAISFAPFLEDNAAAMLNKKNGMEITIEDTSRDELWGKRLDEFKSSPIWGIGFAAHGIGDAKRVGRDESGGSFISVLAQSGVIGFAIVILIWLHAICFPKQIPDDTISILTYGAFVFMSLHCIIEGYMFQAGWYMCLIIWLVVGVMIENRIIKKKGMLI